LTRRITSRHRSVVVVLTFLAAGLTLVACGSATPQSGVGSSSPLPAVPSPTPAAELSTGPLSKGEKAYLKQWKDDYAFVFEALDSFTSIGTKSYEKASKTDLKIQDLNRQMLHEEMMFWSKQMPPSDRMTQFATDWVDGLYAVSSGMASILESHYTDDPAEQAQLFVKGRRSLNKGLGLLGTNRDDYKALIAASQ
jgi:hypothetical protein